MIKHSSAEVTYDKASSLHIGPKGCASFPSVAQSRSSDLTLSYKPRLLAVTSNVAKQAKVATGLRIENTVKRRRNSGLRNVNLSHTKQRKEQ